MPNSAITYMGHVYDADQLKAEARREREHADNIEKLNPTGARQARARAERIEGALKQGAVASRPNVIKGGDAQ